METFLKYFFFGLIGFAAVMWLFDRLFDSGGFFDPHKNESPDEYVDRVLDEERKKG